MNNVSIGKAYQVVKVYFKFKLFGLIFQYRQLLMTSNPSGLVKVLTVSTQVKGS